MQLFSLIVFGNSRNNGPRFKAHVHTEFNQLFGFGNLFGLQDGSHTQVHGGEVIKGDFFLGSRQLRRFILIGLLCKQKLIQLSLNLLIFNLFKQQTSFIDLVSGSQQFFRSDELPGCLVKIQKAPEFFHGIGQEGIQQQAEVG